MLIVVMLFVIVVGCVCVCGGVLAVDDVAMIVIADAISDCDTIGRADVTTR